MILKSNIFVLLYIITQLKNTQKDWCYIGLLLLVVNHCFTSLFGTKALLSDIIIR